jgi:acetyltransferase
MNTTSVVDASGEIVSRSTEPQHEEICRLSDGTKIVIQPVCPRDEAMMVRFHQSLSPESVYARYFNTLKLSQRISHGRLKGVCHPEAGLDWLFVAEVVTFGSEREIVAVGRLSKLQGRGEGEVALIVSDSYQRRGLGTELLRRLIAVAKAERLTGLCARIQLGNAAMSRVCAKLGMRFAARIIAGTVKAELRL